MTDVQTEVQTKERTIDVSLYGCCVVTSKPFPPGTKISLRIMHQSEDFAALGKIAYSARNGEMGIAFTKVELKDELLLEQWIAELRNHRHRAMD
jgi:hypothetical protein